MNILSLPLYLLRILLLTGFATLGLAACGGGGGGSSAPSLQRIEITPPDATIIKGATQQYSAAAVFSDNSRRDVSGSTNWVSSDASTASITASGLATGVKQGSVTITASYQGRSSSTILTVSPATLRSLEISPSNATVAAGVNQQYAAMAIFSDNTKADVTNSTSWSSSNTSIATINSTGLASTLKAGDVTIAGSYMGQSGSAALKVSAAVITSIAVTPANARVAKGNTSQAKATATFSDKTTGDVTSTATWASSSTSVATVGNSGSSRGLVSALNVGSTTISASLQNVTGSTGVTVTAAELVSIEVSPANRSLPKGTTQQYAATGTYTDNSTQNITTAVTWSSSNTGIASISNASGKQGFATAVATGTSTITAASGSVQGSTGVTVTAAVLNSIQVSPSTASRAKGTTQQFTATGTYSDQSTQDLTATVVWSSSDTAVASISNASGSSGLASALATGTATITAASGSVTSTASLTVTAAVLNALQVTPSSASRAKGTTQQFTATGVYSDQSTQDLTASVTWSSSDTTVASISNASGSNGVASALVEGSVTITAASDSVSSTASLTVTAAVLTSVQVTPATTSRAKGTTQQYTATGVYSDQSTQDLTTTVTWSSSDTAIASISNASGSNGLASALAQGSATITAASGSVSSTAALTVTAATLSRIDINPAQPSIPVRTSQQFTATGVYTDNTTQDFTSAATWSSSDSSIVEISNSDGQRGLAVANQQGSVTISASYMGTTGSTTATVSTATLSSIQVTPANRNLAKGFSLQYTAVGTYSDNSSRDITTQVTWASSNTAVAGISNASDSRGLATASSTTGTATISAASGNLTGTTSLTVTAATLTSVTVTPTDPSLPKGTTRQFTATANFSDSSTQDVTSQASWSSKDSSKATVGDKAGSKGSVVAVAVGSSDITASISNATVTTPVSGSSKATVTAATLNRIQVTPDTASAAKGTQQPFTATGTYSDGSTGDITASVTWSSSSTAVATISNTAPDNGKATIAGTGTTTITAALSSVTATATLTGTAAALRSIDVTPKTPSVAAGRTQQFVATGTYSDNSTQVITSSVTWASSNTGVATISNTDGSRGLASSTTSGSTNITATSGSISSTAVTLTVTNAVPVSIAVTPANQTIGNKGTLQYTAMETFSDGSVKDQTTAVTWSSSNTAVVDISNAAGSNGLATSKTQGSVTITATDGGVSPNISGNTGLTVGAATLQSITVSTKRNSLPAGYKVQYNATGNYSDGSTQDLTTSVSWSTLNSGVATVSDAAGSKGVVTTAAAGTTSVLANQNGINGNVQITVTSATLSSIAVTPANATIAGSNTLQYTALATFSDGSKYDITTQVTWASSTTSAATIDQKGLATGGSSPVPGNSTISAKRGTPVVTGQTTVSHTAF